MCEFDNPQFNFIQYTIGACLITFGCNLILKSESGKKKWSAKRLSFDALPRHPFFLNGVYCHCLNKK
jgi:hypothetical protein